MSPVVDYSAMRTPAKGNVWGTLSWWAVVSRFVVHGLVMSTWVSRIPAIKEAIGLNDGALGLALLGSAVGSLIGIPLSGWLVGRLGSREASTWTSVLFCGALIMPAFAQSGPELFLALLLFGAAAGADDVAMNSQAVAQERALGVPVMSRFHGMFSFGGIVGAGLGALVAKYGVTAPVHLVSAALVIVTYSLGFSTALPDPKERSTSAARGRMRWELITTPVMALSAIGFCIFLSEGAIADWTAVYLRQMLRADAGQASAGYAVFSAAMFVFRLAGDRITTFLGSALTIRGGALLAASGLALMLWARSPLWALPGLAMAGAGYSSIIPVVFAAGGRVNPRNPAAGVATVSGLGYLGFLVGPPGIGAISQMTNLRVGLCSVVCLGFLASALVTVVERSLREADSAQSGAGASPLSS